MSATPLTARGKEIRRKVIELAQANGGYHFGGSFSVVEILLAYFAKRSPNDELVLSKGHGCWPLYVILRELGLNPVLEGHPRRDPANGISYTTGSLGHGLPAAAGMAMARKLNNSPGRIVAVLGEGDVQEGTFWESLLIAGHHNLRNLTAVVDLNRVQGSGMVNDILPVYLPACSAAESAGWLIEVEDGHDQQMMERVIFQWSTQPQLIMAHTIKGRGVSFMENEPAWHAHGLDPVQTSKAMEELK
jgi:transketolase